MSSTEEELLAAAIVGLIPSIPPGRHEGTLVELGYRLENLTVVGPSRVVVEFPAGRMSCRWSGGFTAEVVLNMHKLIGRRVLVDNVGQRPVVLCTIETESE